ncbi:predicted protein [Histoplasma capsulatum G186AR]|uniref:Uncharacterized protein n=1 Tax=Ajellomyces capsulatus (strain G186AR / H82 / ATCC MYA-2454 / RMSCC 2432) TaxID=447093 RepID=C0NEL1_AJECG|nr:uncharacterized protein HCBG_01327 [Histoplasma capsulatum G186AR]EEH09682.1 predicted protein [Histoplasma capsulatum G186AR]
MRTPVVTPNRFCPLIEWDHNAPPPADGDLMREDSPYFEFLNAATTMCRIHRCWGRKKEIFGQRRHRTSSRICCFTEASPVNFILVSLQAHSSPGAYARRLLWTLRTELSYMAFSQSNNNGTETN